MWIGSSKRIVVIKDIPSNMIEEAILILKSNCSEKDAKNSIQAIHKNGKNTNDYLIKEAELIINDYIKQNKPQSAENKQTVVKQTTKTKNKFLTNTIINLSLLGSVALLIFILTRLI